MISHIQRRCSEPVHDLADSGPTKSHRNKKSQWQVLGCRAQRGQCAGKRGSPIDRHKESIGSGESLRESSRGSVGRIALSRTIFSPPLALTSVGQRQRLEDGDISLASKRLVLYIYLLYWKTSRVQVSNRRPTFQIYIYLQSIRELQRNTRILAYLTLWFIEDGTTLQIDSY